MEHKTFPAEVVKADEAQGIVETVWAVMGNVDEGLDIIHLGAFTKTFVERGRKVRILDQHQTDSVLRVLGKPLAFRELGHDELPDAIKARCPEATGGAWARVQFNMQTDNGRNVFHLLHAGDVDEWSFGYDVLDSDFSKVVKDGSEVTVRNLRTLKLWEISPVIWGMNQATMTTNTKGREEKPWDIFPENEQYCVYQIDTEGEPVGESLGCHETEEEARSQVEALYANVHKQMTEEDNPEIVPVEEGPFTCECLECGYEMETMEHCRDIVCPKCGGQMRRAERPGAGDGKGATGATDLPIADREHEWDADVADSRVRKWAGGPEKEDIDWAKYRRAHFWYNPDMAEDFGGYKLGFADVIDGKLTAIPRGIFAVAAVLQGGRGGVAIPADDVDAVKARAARYYARMREQFDDDGIVPPWEKSEQEDTLVKAGRVLAERNAARLVSALETIIEILEDAGIDVPGWDRIPRAHPPSETAPVTEQAALQPNAEQAGPDGSSPTSDDEALLNLYKTRIALTGLWED